MYEVAVRLPLTTSFSQYEEVKRCVNKTGGYYRQDYRQHC